MRENMNATTATISANRTTKRAVRARIFATQPS